MLTRTQSTALGVLLLALTFGGTYQFLETLLPSWMMVMGGRNARQQGKIDQQGKVVHTNSPGNSKLNYEESRRRTIVMNANGKVKDVLETINNEKLDNVVLPDAADAPRSYDNAPTESGIEMKDKKELNDISFSESDAPRSYENPQADESVIQDKNKAELNDISPSETDVNDAIEVENKVNSADVDLPYENTQIDESALEIESKAKMNDTINTLQESNAIEEVKMNSDDFDTDGNHLDTRNNTSLAHVQADKRIISFDTARSHLHDVFTPMDHSQTRGFMWQGGPVAPCTLDQAGHNTVPWDADEQCTVNRGKKKRGACKANACCYVGKAKGWFGKSPCFLRRKFMYDAEILFEGAEAIAEYIFTAMEFGTRHGYFGAVKMFKRLQQTMDRLTDTFNDIGEVHNSMPDKKTAAKEFMNQYKEMMFFDFFGVLKSKLVGSAKREFFDKFNRWTQKYQGSKKTQILEIVEGGPDKFHWKRLTTEEWTDAMLDEGVRRSGLLRGVFKDVKFSEVAHAMSTCQVESSKLQDRDAQKHANKECMKREMNPNPEVYDKAFQKAESKPNPYDKCAGENEMTDCMQENTGFTDGGADEGKFKGRDSAASFLQSTTAFATKYGWYPNSSASLVDVDVSWDLTEEQLHFHGSLAHIDDIHNRLLDEGDEDKYNEFVTDLETSLMQQESERYCTVVAFIAYMVLGFIAVILCASGVVAAALAAVPWMAAASCLCAFFLVTVLGFIIKLACELGLVVKQTLDGLASAQHAADLATGNTHYSSLLQLE
eukprot:gnl/MRDRNA2_/MRDRNA2_84933_c0_seq1.p1 gnl/MRDRNA2_/MRDRNA2_84933_c0~~gnl/MRDRNA2_/MRDRNA2_84933_c0_seq1.p1  ORF type:complete len:775 (+),score=130.64 gnl/MRDRNA2_/MRDRNA2_84933_c0_seq1:189-2513(+)